MNDILKRLESLGFTQYESKVFLVMSKGQNMTAAEVAEEAKIPRTSVYDILKSFAEKGICNEIQTPTKLRYEMIDPDIVEDKLESEIRKKYDTRLTDLKSSFKDLRPLYKAAGVQPLQDVELLRGFNKHRSVKLAEMIADAKKEILTMTHFGGKKIAIDDTQTEEAAKFLKKKGVIRSIYEVSGEIKIKRNNVWTSLDNNGIVDLLKEMSREGAQVRVAEKIPKFMVIVDRVNVFFSLNVTSILSHNITDVIIKNEDFAGNMAELFESCWNRSMTINQYKLSTRS